MKKGIVIAIVVVILLSLYSACSPKTVTYYYDANGMVERIGAKRYGTKMIRVYILLTNISTHYTY